MYNFPVDFFCILIQKRCVLWSNTLSQSFQWYSTSSIPWHVSLHFFDRMVSKSRNFYENNMILWYYQIWPKVVWKVVHGLMDTVTRTKTKKTLPSWKTRAHVCYFFRAVYHSKTMWFPTLLLLPSWKPSCTFYIAEKQQEHASQILQTQPLLKTISKIVINCNFDFELIFALQWR